MESKSTTNVDEGKIDSLLQAMPCGFCLCELVYDENSRPVDIIFEIVNSAYEKMNGYRENSLKGKRLLEIYPDADISYFNIFEDVISNSKTTPFIYKGHTLNSEKIYEVLCYPQDQKRFMCIISDSADRESKEYRAQQDQQTILDVMPVAIRLLDIESMEIVYINKACAKMLNLPNPEMAVGLNVSKFVPVIQPDGIGSIEKLAFLIMSEEPISSDFVCLTAKGEHVETLLTSCIIEYNGKKTSLGIMQNLTAEKEYQKMLLKAAEHEKEANQAKSLFLANMSHEIRTPMNGVIGMIDLLMNEKLTDRQMQCVTDIKTSATSLLDIINEILDISKIAEGRLQIQSVDVDLSSLLKNIISMMKFSARSKRIEFVEDICINSPEYIVVDDVRLRQILVNLLSNAIKFTNKGYVKLHTKIVDDNIIFIISDTGFGIKPDELPMIFVAFEQADTKKNRQIKGTGLGLSISKSLVEMMGGQIRVESEYGVGSTFYVTIPYIKGDEEAVENIDTPFFEHLMAPTAKVLLVDDIQTNLTVGAGLLRLYGITADVAISGFEAIDLVKRIDYDLVFMDHMMPDMDGVETVEIIRGLGNKFKKLPIIALTANAINEAKTLLLTSGMDDFLSKPIDKADLMIILNKWLPKDKVEVDGSLPQGEIPATYSDVLNAAAKIKGMNIELALGRIGGAHDLLEKTIKQVAHSLDDYLKKLDTSLSDKDLRRFSIDIHGMKSILANIGAFSNSELAAELEIVSKAGNIKLCTEKFAVFACAMEGFAHELKAILPNDIQIAAEEGNTDFLKKKISDTIDFLDGFEFEDALVCLTELSRYTFGGNTDKLLLEAKNAVNNFGYKDAVSFLKKIEF